MWSRKVLSEKEIQQILAAVSGSEDISELNNLTSSESETEHTSSDEGCAQPVSDIEIQQIVAAGFICLTSPTRHATSRVADMKSAFKVVFTTPVESIVIKNINIECERVFGSKSVYIETVTFQAYIGLLLSAGVYNSYGESTKSPWNVGTGCHISRATMSLEQFCIISCVSRFDEKAIRQERVKDDKLVAIRFIWEKWDENLSKLYYPHDNVTVDDQLVGFRGRCPFNQYIPSKPSKYGVKIWALCDSNTSYVLKIQMYTGKHLLGKSLMTPYITSRKAHFGKESVPSTSERAVNGAMQILPIVK
ncbi:hypothetical protein PR048_026675 [Dryococelus australis]|uniref:PiggyBac transposable element-derived protein domain-containing protein n=1 Tax=Dryococelus australis TaxID=614101 RepID=A0ABQ9GM14_9NEOP|nr:hypothetical protein PR048_026675 [Dryococelus australis]